MRLVALGGVGTGGDTAGDEQCEYSESGVHQFVIVSKMRIPLQ